MRWHLIHNPITRRPAMLRLADRLGRSRGRARWLDHVVNSPPAPRRPDLTRWHEHELAAVWIGHATVLLRVGSLNVLVDPVFSAKVGLGLGLMTAGPRRFVAPALSIAQLPPIDLILVTHAHFDHLDRPSLNRLPKTAHVVTSEHNGDLIRDLGFAKVTELRWNERVEVGGVAVTARRVNHWGARAVLDRHRGFAGFLLDAPRPRGGRSRRVLCGGDSAYHEHYTDLERVDLAILGIGGYNPWIESHANPEEAWRMSRHMRAEFLLPIHHRTFKLSHEPVNEPMERLLTSASTEADRVVGREIGELWAG